MRGTRAFLAANGLDIFDITTPDDPVLMGKVAAPWEIRGVEVVGDIAYVTDTHLGIVAVDVSIPDRPTVFGTVDIEGFSHRIVHHRNRLFVAAAFGGLAVVEPNCDNMPP